MNAWQLVRSLTPTQRNTFIASFLGWALDAFDYFLVVFVVSHIATDFRLAVVTVTVAITVTLMMRPVGALFFGYLADRFGRRLPMMIDIVFYSVIELLTAFSPNFTIFLILRALFGIGMGGEWGIGASLAMESLPTRTRGLFSGILQEGYSFGYLLAAVAFFAVFPHFGWRGMFVLGAIPALLVVFIRSRVPESPVWQERQARNLHTAAGMLQALRRHWVLLIYAVLLMTAFNFMSHGTQDLYPTFLQNQVGLGVGATSTIAIIYNIGAICGGILFGYYSQHWGRRRSILVAAVIGLLLIPLWAGLLTTGVVLLTIGAFLMQFMVQGAWGVIPVHLNELSPSAVRGTFPGFAYQLGNLFSAISPVLVAGFATNFHTARGPNYAVAQAIVAAVVFVAVIFFTAIGREARGIELAATEEDEEQPAPGMLGAQPAS